MRITTCLAWYHEPVSHLYRAVSSLTGIADTIVAIDGAWQHYPNPQACSPDNQARAIEDAARNAGIDCTVVTGRIWGSQVEKRDYLMREAAGPNGGCPDWLLVIDGDEEIIFCADSLRRTLRDTGRDVATVLCRHLDDEAHQAPIRRLYRASAGITVHHAHNGYRTTDGRWLHGDPAHVRLEPAVALPITLVHHARSRGEQRNAEARQYRNNRRAADAEQWPNMQRATQVSQVVA